MTTVRDLDFAFAVVTFDDRNHPEGVRLAATAPLTPTGPFTAFARWPDGSFAWLSSTAVWGEDGHPWALVRRFSVSADADGAPPARSDDPRLDGGGELRITDDLTAGRATLSPAHTPSRPRRVSAQAWDAAHERPTRALSVSVQDGVTDAEPATITVLDGPGLASGTTLITEPALASRLAAAASPAIVDVAVASASEPGGWLRRRATARVPQRLAVIATIDGGAHGR